MKTVSAAFLPMITIDRRARRPLHQQVYDAYRTAIADGTLRAAQKVPSTRVLAAELGVSRIPVLHAYAQLLAEGYFQSRVGAGTEVARSRSERPKQSQPAVARSGRANPGLRPLAKLPSLAVAAEGALGRRGGAFVVGQVAHDHFPVRVWNALVARHARRTDARSLSHGGPMGLRSLREAIATYLRTVRAVRCEAEQIMVVSGSQQAIEISARALLNSGHRVWMEEPGHQLARNVFALHRCRVVSVPVDEEGLNVAAGIQQCRNARVALVTPSYHFPLGVTMTALRRSQLLDWAERSGAWILEYDHDSEYRYEATPIASLQGLDPNSRVVYIGTFSRVLFPSLGLGYVVVPPDLVDRFAAIQTAMDGGPPTFSQALVADFIREGHFSRHMRRMRSLYGERRNQLIESLRNELPSGIELAGGRAGLQLAVTLDGFEDVEIAERGARQELWLSPLSPCYAGGGARQGLILGFGSVAVEDIPKGVRRLRAVIGVH
jgi:GntR family transcriptional regulator / MocR family aminotransferase